MAKIDVLNKSGEKVSELELSDSIFAVKISKPAMHSAVVAYLANQRQGTQSALTRSEVRGGGIKPWRRARAQSAPRSGRMAAWCSHPSRAITGCPSTKS